MSPQTLLEAEGSVKPGMEGRLDSENTSAEYCSNTIWFALSLPVKLAVTHTLFGLDGVQVANELITAKGKERDVLRYFNNQLSVLGSVEGEGSSQMAAQRIWPASLEALYNKNEDRARCRRSPCPCNRIRKSVWESTTHKPHPKSGDTSFTVTD